MNPTIKKNIEKLELITKKIKKETNEISSQDISTLISEFEKMTRKEKSAFYNHFFDDAILAGSLIRIARFHESDNKLLIKIVSSLGNMCARYDLYPSDDLYNLFFSLKNKRKVDYYVSLFIFRFPQFKVWEYKWDYILTIPDMSPKEKSMRNFYMIINDVISSGEAIPATYKMKILNSLTLLSEKNMYKEELIELANKIKIPPKNH